MNVVTALLLPNEVYHLASETEAKYHTLFDDGFSFLFFVCVITMTIHFLPLLFTLLYNVRICETLSVTIYLNLFLFIFKLLYAQPIGVINGFKSMSLSVLIKLDNKPKFEVNVMICDISHSRH